mmetsp:Transcript_16094/g.27181  ORF Transcript_16094/g.27181 Transcript_16094/m.27181 type:complete len:451 (-) Transcript_16094:1582-2934(-)
MRPLGFTRSGKERAIKKNSHLGVLREYGERTKTNPKLAVCITMYNENEAELKTTMRGVLQNYKAMNYDPTVRLKQQELVVVVVCDGFDRVPESFQNFAKDKGFFDVEVLKNQGFLGEQADGSWKMKEMGELMDETAEEVPKNCLHMFQTTTADFGLDEGELADCRVNFVFALKQRNDGKINSHSWFFRGICEYLQAELTLMLDIGTRPDDYAIAKLYKYMINNSKCGGCCGEIEVDFTNNEAFNYTYLVLAAQYYEYKLGHVPDKCCEGFFGYITVLPGAYSMYRLKAVQGSPMEKFFKGVDGVKDATCGEANEYLAEDRVMGLQVYLKEDSGYYHSFIPDAKAYTDAPETLMMLMKQRRRWLNGSLFTALRAIRNLHKMAGFGAGHSFFRKIGILIYMFYFVPIQLFAFLQVGSYYAGVKNFMIQYFMKATSSPEFAAGYPMLYDFFQG